MGLASWVFVLYCTGERYSLLQPRPHKRKIIEPEEKYLSLLWAYLSRISQRTRFKAYLLSLAPPGAPHPASDVQEHPFRPPSRYTRLRFATTLNLS